MAGPRRTAMTTTTGRRAATEPLRLISAVSTETSSMVRTSSRVRLSPACRIRNCPVQAVTPVASSPALTTNSEAMKTTAGSPKPASAWPRSSTPVAQRASDVASRHDHHREAVPDEQHHDRGDDREGERDVTQDYGPPPASSVPRSASGSLVRPAPGARLMPSPARSGKRHPLWLARTPWPV